MSQRRDFVKYYFSIWVKMTSFGKLPRISGFEGVNFVSRSPIWFVFRTNCRSCSVRFFWQIKNSRRDFLRSKTTLALVGFVTHWILVKNGADQGTASCEIRAAAHRPAAHLGRRESPLHAENPTKSEIHYFQSPSFTTRLCLLETICPPRGGDKVVMGG